MTPTIPCCCSIIVTVALSSASFGGTQGLGAPIHNPANGHLYALTTEPVTLQEARTIAAAADGYVVSVTSADEQAWINSTFAPVTPASDVWIGLSDEVVEGVWIWDSGEPFDFADWHQPTEPNDHPSSPTGEDYVHMTFGLSNGQWWDAPSPFYSGGLYRHFAIVEWVPKPPPGPEYHNPCLPQPTLFDSKTGTVYTMTPTRMSFHDARAYAQSINGHLVSYASAAEEAMVFEFFYLSGHLQGDWAFWIGLTDELVEGDWRWESGEPLTYTNWAIGEPNNYPHTPEGEDYAVYVVLQGPVITAWMDVDQPSTSFVIWGIVEIPPDAPRCFGDGNCDRSVNGADLSFLLGVFGADVAAFPAAAGCDFNGDGVVNAADLSVLLANFGTSCLP